MQIEWHHEVFIDLFLFTGHDFDSNDKVGSYLFLSFSNLSKLLFPKGFFRKAIDAATEKAWETYGRGLRFVSNWSSGLFKIRFS